MSDVFKPEQFEFSEEVKQRTMYELERLESVIRTHKCLEEEVKSWGKLVVQQLMQQPGVKVEFELMANVVGTDPDKENETCLVVETHNEVEQMLVEQYTGFKGIHDALIGSFPKLFLILF
ncbi:hypothetical protein TNCV_3896151 [Trichonephila clavipes]|nr:hypothetical protein TNCV_3896151 [Trichonephila clavipes]